MTQTFDMKNLFDLTGKAAVVTGGGTGIGLAMAKGLAGAGAKVVIWGRRQEKLDAAIAEAKAEGLTLTAQQVDVSDKQQIIDGFEQAVADLGGLDIVVANAGMSAGKTKLLDIQGDEYQSVLTTNLDGVLWTIQQSAKHMVDAGSGGSIITIASLAAVEGTPGNYAYGASKAGVVSFTKAAAVELARYKIRVNSVLPGWIATDMTEGAQGNDAFNNAVIPRVPERRWGRPEEFASVAVYLGSDSSSYQTGTTTVIDGGYSIF